MGKDIILRPMHPDVEARLANEFDWDPSRPLAEQWPWSSPISNRPHEPAPDPLPGWQQKVLAECDRIDEQRRHAVAASVALFERLCETLPDEQVDYMRESIPGDGTKILDGIDQSAPTAAPDAKLIDVPDPQRTDSEETQPVIAVDARFDTDVEP